HANVEAEIASVRLLNASGEAIGAAPTTEDVFIRIRLKVRKGDAGIRGIVDVRAKGVLVFRAVQPDEYITERRGVVDLLVRIPAHLLAEATYTVNVTVHTRHGKEAKVLLPSALTFMGYGGTQAGAYKGGGLRPPIDCNLHSHMHARKQDKSVV